jgi:hypothetical protein
MTEHTPSYQIDGIKLVADYFKHLTTMSSGSIVVIATI